MQDERPPSRLSSESSDRPETESVLQFFHECFQHAEIGQSSLQLNPFFPSDYSRSSSSSSSTSPPEEPLYSAVESPMSDMDEFLSSPAHPGPSSSSPSSIPSFSFSPRSVDGIPANSYDTNVTIPSPSSSTSAGGKGKGKQVAEPSTATPSLPALSFEEDDRAPTRVIGWQPDFLDAGQAGPSSPPSASPDQLSLPPPSPLPSTSSSSGISRALNDYRSDAVKIPNMSMAVTSLPGSPSPSSPSTSNLPSPVEPSSPLSLSPPMSPSERPNPARSLSMSMNIKLKLKRSREFLKGKKLSTTAGGESPLSSSLRMTSTSGSGPSTPSASSSLSSSKKNGKSVAYPPSRDMRRSYTSPLPVLSSSNTDDLRSTATPPILTLSKWGPEEEHQEENSSIYSSVLGDVVPEPQQQSPSQTKTKVTPRPDMFDLVLPVEIRLYVFSCLVQSFVDEHAKLVDSGRWSVVKAAQTRWVGWEGGIRELVKISRVSRTWQSLALDGQLWSTLGGTTALPPSILTRISRMAGPFVRSLQLEGIGTLSPETLVEITSNISIIKHHVPSINFHSSFPVEHWLTNVTDVNLSGCASITTRSLHKLLASCTSLMRLCLRGLTAVTNTTCIIIGDANPLLTVLDLSQCAGMDSFGIQLICEATRRRHQQHQQPSNSPLVELRLSGLRRITQETISLIAEWFPDLEVLDLSYAQGLEDDFFVRFTEWRDDMDIGTEDIHGHSPPMMSQAQPRSQSHIQLSSRDVGLDPADRTIYHRRITNLRHLNLSHCAGLTDRTCSHFAYAVPRLELLELAGLGPALEDAGVTRLLGTTPLIRKVDLEDASRLTDDVLFALTPTTTTTGSSSVNRSSGAVPIPIPIPQRRSGGMAPRMSPFTSTTTKTTKTQSPVPRPGEALEHLIISYSAFMSAQALSSLIKACTRLHTLEADNTRISDNVVREFVDAIRQRSIRNATLVAIDCASVGRPTVDDLASRDITRPRDGWRSWKATALLGLMYADEADGDYEGGYFGGGLDECDDSKVVLKSFRSWQMVDKWTADKGRRKKAAAAAAAGGAGENGGAGREGKRWFGRRSTSTSTPSSGPGTPGLGISEDDERGCVIM